MLISNPFASPFFWPTFYTAGGLLGGALVILVAIMRFNVQRLGRSVLFQRLLVWAIIAPIYALAVLSGPLATLLLVSLLVWQGLREYVVLVGLPEPYARVLLALGLLAAPAALIALDAFYLLPALLLIGGTLQPLFFAGQGPGVRHLAFAALGWGYLPWFLGHLLLIALYIRGGPGILLAIGMATALSDVGAFMVGKRFGRHRLAPRLSPNKTWEGLAGNFVGALAGVALLTFALPPDRATLLLVLLPPLIAVGAVWGDLLESSFKREFAVKDAGTWLPGFGGLLDRVDSLIIVAPLVFYLLRLLG